MKRFWELLRERKMKIINFRKKKLKLLTTEQQGSCENAKNCYICKEKFEKKYLKDRKYRKVSYHCQYTGEYRGAAHSICYSSIQAYYSVSKKIPIVFHNGSNYDYHFIRKELAKEFKVPIYSFLVIYSSSRKESYKN